VILFIVIPEMARIEITFPPVILNKSYTVTCDAAGDPRPIVNASLNATEHCLHQIYITNTTMYTAQATLRIPSVTAGCCGTIFYCSACQLETCQEVTMELNITEGKISINLMWSCRQTDTQTTRCVWQQHLAVLMGSCTHYTLKQCHTLVKNIYNINTLICSIDTHPMQATGTNEVPTTTRAPASSGAESSTFKDKIFALIDTRDIQIIVLGCVVFYYVAMILT